MRVCIYSSARLLCLHLLTFPGACCFLSLVRMVNATDGIMCHALLVPSSPVPDARLLGAPQRRSSMMLHVPVEELSRCGSVRVEEHPGASRTNNHKECKNGSRYRRESSQPSYEEIAGIHAIKQASNLTSCIQRTSMRRPTCHFWFYSYAGAMNWPSTSVMPTL